MIVVSALFNYLAAIGISTISNFISLGSALNIALEQTCGALMSLWGYLCYYSFCPWLMIFKGRSAKVILFDILELGSKVTYGNSISDVLELSYNAVTLLSELLVGPALGLAIAFLQAFLMFKSGALVFGKVMNRLK